MYLILSADSDLLRSCLKSLSDKVCPIVPQDFDEARALLEQETPFSVFVDGTIDGADRFVRELRKDKPFLPIYVLLDGGEDDIDVYLSCGASEVVSPRVDSVHFCALISRQGFTYT